MHLGELLQTNTCGLTDRQSYESATAEQVINPDIPTRGGGKITSRATFAPASLEPVSYTHLTLPTIYSV